MEVKTLPAMPRSHDGTAAIGAYLAQQSIVAIFLAYGAANRSATSEYDGGNW
jgi:hypothetical protein